MCHHLCMGFKSMVRDRNICANFFFMLVARAKYVVNFLGNWEFFVSIHVNVLRMWLALCTALRPSSFFTSARQIVLSNSRIHFFIAAMSWALDLSLHAFLLSIVHNLEALSGTASTVITDITAARWEGVGLPATSTAINFFCRLVLTVLCSLQKYMTFSILYP